MSDEENEEKDDHEDRCDCGTCCKVDENLSEGCGCLLICLGIGVLLNFGVFCKMIERICTQ